MVDTPGSALEVGVATIAALSRWRSSAHQTITPRKFPSAAPQARRNPGSFAALRMTQKKF